MGDERKRIVWLDGHDKRGGRGRTLLAFVGVLALLVVIGYVVDGNTNSDKNAAGFATSDIGAIEKKIGAKSFEVLRWYAGHNAHGTKRFLEAATPYLNWQEGAVPSDLQERDRAQVLLDLIENGSIVFDDGSKCAICGEKYLDAKHKFKMELYQAGLVVEDVKYENHKLKSLIVTRRANSQWGYIERNREGVYVFPEWLPTNRATAIVNHYVME